MSDFETTSFIRSEALDSIEIQTKDGPIALSKAGRAVIVYGSKPSLAGATVLGIKRFRLSHLTVFARRFNHYEQSADSVTIAVDGAPLPMTLNVDILQHLLRRR